MKIIPTFCCRLISKRISKIFKKYQNKKPALNSIWELSHLGYAERKALLNLQLN